MDSLFPLQSQDGLGCSVAWLQGGQSSCGLLVCTPKASDNPHQELFHQVSISPTHLLVPCICRFLDLTYHFLRERSFLWWRNKSWIHTHAVLAVHSTSTDNRHVSSASREKQRNSYGCQIFSPDHVQKEVFQQEDKYILSHRGKTAARQKM